ncbi:17057_t:CDS:2, partial [Gigaspora margarita]
YQQSVELISMKPIFLKFADKEFDNLVLNLINKYLEKFVVEEEKEDIQELLNKKDTKLDLEDLIDNYLEVMKDWLSGPKRPKSESSYPLKFNSIENSSDKDKKDEKGLYKTKKLIEKENLNHAIIRE